MLASSGGILCAPLEPGQHLRAMALFNDAAACNARETGVFRVFRIKLREHIVPRQHLHMRAMRTRNERHFLRTGFKVFSNSASRQNHGSGSFQYLGKLNGSTAIVGLCFRVASGVIFPFSQVILHLEVNGYLRQGGGRICAGYEQRSEPVGSFFIQQGIACISGPLREMLLDRRDTAHHRLKFEL